MTTIPEDIRLKKIDSDRMQSRINELDRIISEMQSKGCAPPFELLERRALLIGQRTELDWIIASLSEYVEAAGVVG